MSPSNEFGLPGESIPATRWKYAIKQLRSLARELLFDLNAYPAVARHILIGRKQAFELYGVNPSTISIEQAQHPAVIYVHGFWSNQGCWLPFLNTSDLMPKGPRFTFNYASTVEDGLRQLQKNIHKLQILYASHGIYEIEIDLVGHSLGAITSAAYSLFHLPHSGVRVRRLVSIAGRLRITPGSAEFSRRSVTPLVEAISAAYQKNPTSMDLHLVAGSADRLVPQTSILVHENEEKRLVVPDRGHLSILHCPHTIKTVNTWLTQ